MQATLRCWQEKNGTVCAELTLPIRPSGHIKIRTCVDSLQVRDAMKRAGVNFDQVGSIFGDIGHFIKKVAHSGAMKSLGKIATVVFPVPALGTKLAMTPQGQAAMNVLAPGSGSALKAITMGTKLLSAANGTDAKAKRARLVIAAASAQAKLENKARKPLPLPKDIAAKSKDVRNAYRYVVTVQRAVV